MNVVKIMALIFLIIGIISLISLLSIETIDIIKDWKKTREPKKLKVLREKREELLNKLFICQSTIEYLKREERTRENIEEIKAKEIELKEIARAISLIYRDEIQCRAEYLKE